MFSRVFRFRFFAALLPVLAMSAVAFAFAAANTVPESGAGDGSATISGYAVTNVSYTLNATNPANIDSVAFEVNPIAGASAPTTVKARLVTDGTWYACSGGPVNWTCNVTGVTALAANNLQVVAAQ